MLSTGQRDGQASIRCEYVSAWAAYSVLLECASSLKGSPVGSGDTYQTVVCGMGGKSNGRRCMTSYDEAGRGNRGSRQAGVWNEARFVPVPVNSTGRLACRNVIGRENGWANGV